MSERPGHHRPRRLADWLNPTGARKAHSLIDKEMRGRLGHHLPVRCAGPSGSSDGESSPEQAEICGFIRRRRGLSTSGTGLSFSATRSSAAVGRCACQRRRSRVAPRRGRCTQSRERSRSRHFKDQIRRLTRRKAPVTTTELIQQINPVLRGWGEYYKRAHVRQLFHRLDRLVVQRICGASIPALAVLRGASLPERKRTGSGRPDQGPD